MYLFDLASGNLNLVSENAHGEAVGGGGPFAFSPDGAKFVFHSGALADPSEGPPGGFGLHVLDLASGTTAWIGADGRRPVFSADGRWMAFNGFAGLPGRRDIRLHNLVTGATSFVADAADNSVGTGNPTFSADGTRLAFWSTAPDLVPNDANGTTADVFIAALDTADLVMTVAAEPEPVTDGGSITYQLMATNDGPQAADDLAVSLVLPLGATYVGVDSSAGSCDPPTPEQPLLVTCHLDSLGSGESLEATVTAQVSGVTGQPLKAIAATSASTVARQSRRGHQPHRLIERVRLLSRTNDTRSRGLMARSGG